MLDDLDFLEIPNNPRLIPNIICICQQIQDVQVAGKQMVKPGQSSLHMCVCAMHVKLHHVHEHSECFAEKKSWKYTWYTSVEKMDIFKNNFAMFSLLINYYGHENCLCKKREG